MAPLRFLNLFALSALVLLACTFNATPVDALSAHHVHLRDGLAHGHAAIAKAKRETSTVDGKRCKVRSSSVAPTSTKKSSGATTTHAATTTTHTTSTKHSTTTSSKAVSTSTSSTSSTSGYKVGLAWANGDSPDLKNFVTSHVKYIYTWSPEIPSNAKSLGLIPMPMLWGSNQISDFTKLVVKGYANIAMGFNEPNEPGQSNMDAGTGASLWKKYLEPLLNEGYELVAPATSSNPNGRTWMDNWYKACNGGCNPTYHAIHYYDVSSQGMITYMEQWYEAYGKPIMATEFACQNFNGGAQCSQSETNDFFATVIAFMNKTSWVKAYFAFGIMHDMQGVNTDNQLMASSGEPTALGYSYIDGQ